MNKSSKLLTLVAAVAVFVALGTGIAFAYSSGYHSGAAGTPATAAALVAPAATLVNAAVLATPVNAALVVTPTTSATTGTPTAARVIPPKPGPSYHWDADNWCWNAPIAPANTTPTTTQSSPTHHDSQTYHHDATGGQGCP